MKSFYIFAIAAFVVLSGIAGILVKKNYDAAFLMAQQREKESFSSTMQKKFNDSMSAADIQMSDVKARDKKFTAFWKTIQTSELVRMKVWNDDYTIVWIDLGSYTNQRFADNDEVQEAYQGEAVYEVVSGADKSENITERQFGELSEIYIPIFDSENKVAGVFETYRLTTGIRGEAMDAVIRFVAWLVVPLLSAFGLVLVCVHYFFRKKETEKRK